MDNQDNNPVPSDPGVNPVPTGTGPIPAPSGAGKNKLLIPGVILVVLLLGIIGVFAYQNFQIKQSQTPTTQAPSTRTLDISPPATDSTADWETYSSGEISFKYPPDWKTITEFGTFLHPSYAVIALASQSEDKNSINYPPVSIIYYDNPNLLSPKNYDEDCCSEGMMLGLYSPSATEKIVSGISSQYQTPANCEPLICDKVVIPYKNKIYVITNVYSNNVVPSQQETFNQILSTFEFIDSTNTSNASNQLVHILYQGGLCPDGICVSTTTISHDGSVVVSGVTKSPISSAEIDTLSNLIEETNFVQIKSKKFTGLCPTAYDGQEVIYTFYSSYGTQVISSCEVQIDPESPLFSKVTQLISQ